MIQTIIGKQLHDNTRYEHFHYVGLGVCLVKPFL